MVDAKKILFSMQAGNRKNGETNKEHATVAFKGPKAVAIRELAQEEGLSLAALVERAIACYLSMKDDGTLEIIESESE